MESILLIRAAGVDAKGMDILAHHVPQGCVDHPMALQTSTSDESRRHDTHGEVTTAITRTSVTGVGSAVVPNVKLQRGETLL